MPDDSKTLHETGSAEESPGGPVERARTLVALANLDIDKARLDEADKNFNAAAELSRAAGDRAGEIEARAGLAKVLNQRGQNDAAAKLYDQVLPEIDLIADPSRRLTILLNAATAQQFAGRSDEATGNLLRVIDLARQTHSLAQEGGAAQALGLLYWNRGDYLQAQAFITRAHEIARADNDLTGQSATLQTAGMMARFNGEYVKALAMHEQAVTLAQNPIFKMRAMRHVALDYAAMDNFPKAIAQMRTALATPLEDPNHHAFTDLKVELAEMLVEHGDGSRGALAEAKTLLARALQKCQQVHDQLREISARRVTALLLAAERKPADALAEYKRTIELIFNYRNSSTNEEFRAASLAQEQPAFRGYLDLVMDPVAARAPGVFKPALPAEENALRLLEQARESHLGAPRSANLDAAATAHIEALLAQMADESLKIARLVKARRTDAESAELADLQLAMSRARAEIDRERSAVSLSAAKPLAGNGARNWRAVAPDGVQLSYALGNKHAFVWMRSARGLEVAALTEKPQSIEREIAALASLDRQQSPDKVMAAISHLSSVVMPPGLLPKDSQSVEIVAEGRLASVPFAALRSPTDPARQLIQTHSVSMVSSMYAMEAAPKPHVARPFRLVALASGNGALRSASSADPLPRLQAATKEIGAVADLFTTHEPAAQIKLLMGAEGNAAALSGIWSSGADVVHFATHALADLRQPLASLLVLPANDAAGAPTYLTAGQIQGWHGDADLVFLSACDSAIGPPRFAGGMPGLQLAFLRAGARGVIATLWPIEDVLAQEFSKDFYRHYTAGASAVQALSATQREWLMPKSGESEAQQRRRAITAFAHAYFER